MLLKILLKFSIVIAVYILFSAVFSLLQNRTIYDNTLGMVSTNYERSGTAKRYIIYKVSDPYNCVTETNAYNWDATYYLTIRNKLYADIDPHYIDRYAFYPFFPIIWKISGIRSQHIILVNYLFFGLGIILLSQLFMKNKPRDIFFFILALLIPSAIVFYLPYAESLFVLTFAIALWGLFRQKYWLYFIGMICFSMTRPAVIVLMVAFIGTDLIYLFRHRNFKHFIKQSGLTIAPVILGCLAVIVMQYCYSGSWTAYFDTADLWPKESGFLNKISDWSTEGFGMNSFSVIFLALPAFIYSLILGVSALIKKPMKNTVSLFAGNEVYIKEYMFNVSMMFMAGILGYFFLTSGNVLNGFFRYTMAVPFFYIILFLLPEKLRTVALRYKIGVMIFTTALLFSLLLNIHYTGDIWRFEYLGLYMLVLTVPLVLFEQYFSEKAKNWVILLYVIPAVVWHTYLFNMYLSNVWIFT
jgi:hypothetical protein